MSEISVGEYVRTEKGYIFKVKHDKTIQIIDFLDVQYGKVINHSKNLIDLVEAGDVVNDDLFVYKGRTANGEEKLLAGNYIIHGMDLKVVNIKSIVTKEQFNSVKYEVGE